MSKTDESYVTQISKLAGTFKKSCGAAVLYYWGDGADHGLRLECITVMKEFLNNVKFGSDPEGLLFYNENSDFNFESDEKVDYKTFYNTETPMVIRTEFYLQSDSTEKKPFATFITNSDKTSRVIPSHLQNGSGIWQDLKIGINFCKIHKVTNDSTVTLRVLPLGKKVTFRVTDNSKQSKIETTGLLYCHNITDLQGSDALVNYDDDRIIFYPAGGTSYQALFFANERLLIDNQHQSDADRPKATWSSL